VGDRILYIAGLDVSAEQALAREAELVRRLTRDGLLAANPRFGRVPGAWRFVAGPRADGLVSDEQVDDSHEADVRCGRETYHAGEDFTPPPCPTCGHVLGDAVHLDHLAVWSRHAEPVVVCPDCGAEQRLGDWEWNQGAYVAELAVAFLNWPEPTDDFIAAVGALLGGRWRTVLCHG
jgi:predicted RNA-binding Zn-ribbon protein involved in translation (DUF1610 family)